MNICDQMLSDKTANKTNRANVRLDSGVAAEESLLNTVFM